MKSRSTTELAIMGLLCAFLLVPYFSVMNNISRKFDDDEDDRILKAGKFLVLSVATRETCGLIQFERSADINNLPLKILGLGQPWKGFGYKLLLLKHELEPFKNDTEKIVLVADGYDVLFNANVDQILEKFLKFNARLVFSAETNCWPDEELCHKTPEIENGKRFLNAGLYIGYASELYRALTAFPYHDDENDQRYYYKIYVNETLRAELNFTLDHRCEIFQTMEGGANHIELLFDGERPFLYNRLYKSQPLMIHTPGYCRNLHNILADFIPKVWEPEEGEDVACLMDNKDLYEAQPHEYPVVMIAVLIDTIRTSLKEFLIKLHSLAYPKEKIHLYFRYGEGKRYAKLVKGFVQRFGEGYGSIKLDAYTDANKTFSPNEDMGFEDVELKRPDYYLNLNSVTLLEDPDALRYLIEQNRSTIVPSTFGVEKKSENFMFFLSIHDPCRNYVEIIKKNDRLVVGMF